MNDTETNRQRPEAPTGEPSHRSADTSRDALPDAERGTPADQDTVATPVTSEPRAGADAPADTTVQLAPDAPAGGYPATRQFPGTPDAGPDAAAAQAGPPQRTATSGQGGHAAPPGHSGSAGPGQGGYPQAAGTGYPQSAAPGHLQTSHPQPGHPQPGHPQAGHPQAGAHGSWQRPAESGYQHPGAHPHEPAYQNWQAQQTWQQEHGGGQLPPWAAQVGAAEYPARRGRGGKLLATAAAAVVLALGAGGVGAWAALEFAGPGTGTATTTSANSEVTRVVDRSSLAEIAKKAQASVVSISAGTGSGSGVVLNEQGFILSNNHVVSSSPDGSVTVAFSDGKTAAAKIVGTDPRTDLAVVKVDGMTGLTPAVLGDSAAMEVGDTVLALGSPLGLEGSVTAGIVSAKDRTIQASAQGQPNPMGQQGASSISGLLQTDAPINPGNSGGALVNTNAEVIGINTAIATSGQSTGNIGVGFAIPSNKAKQVADALMNGRKVSHPYLGVSLSSRPAGGAVIAAVAANGPAARAGLREADVITELNGKRVNDADDVISVVQSGTVGQRLEIKYNRNGQPATATATLADMP